MAKRDGRVKKSAAQIRQQTRLLNCQKAMQLRIAGYDYRSIGEMEHISHMEAMRRVNDALDMTMTQMDQDATQLRAIETQRLEALWRVLWPKANEGDIEAIDRVMKLHALRTRLLGLDINQVSLQVDDQAVAVLADIITKHIKDPRQLALIRADFAAFIQTQKKPKDELPALPSGIIEGEFSRVSD